MLFFNITKLNGDYSFLEFQFELYSSRQSTIDGVSWRLRNVFVVYLHVRQGLNRRTKLTGRPRLLLPVGAPFFAHGTRSPQSSCRP
jgi:hypothetical protein